MQAGISAGSAGKGHACMRTIGGSVTKRRRKRLHRYAGHLARIAYGVDCTASVPAALLGGGIDSADSPASTAAYTRTGSRHYPGGKHSLQLPTEKLRPPMLNSTSGGLPSRPTAVCGRAGKTRSPTRWMRNVLVVVLPRQAWWCGFPRRQHEKERIKLERRGEQKEEKREAT